MGIGTRMLGESIDFSRRLGYETLELDVVADNVRALALYRSFGFEEYGRLPKGFRLRDGSHQELILMKLDLR